MDRRNQYEEALIIVLVVAVNLMTGAAERLLSVDASPKTLNRSGDTARLTLTWTANSSASSSDMDWLGIYNPPDSADDHFIGYVLLSSFCPNWMKQEGSCYLDLPLINLRRSYEFRVFRWDKSDISNTTPMDEDHNPLPSTAHLLARSDPLSFRNFNDPAQLHLAFTSNQDEMRVMFLTSDDIKSYARYGLDEGKLDSVARAQSVTYTRPDMCDEPANTSLGWRDPGYIHDAVMQGLEPGKRYFYQVGSDEGGADSRLSIHSLKIKFTFKTQTSFCAELHDNSCGSRAIDIIEDSTELSEESQLKEGMKILHRQGIGTNLCSYASLLEDCIRMEAMADGKLVHAHLIESGCKPNNFLETKLVIMYAKCGIMSDARRVFEMSEQNVISSTAMIAGYAKNGDIWAARTVFQNIPQRDVVTWNAMIAAYAQNGFSQEALEVFRQMQEAGMHPSSVTFSSVLSSCANLVALEQGKEVHGYIIRSGIPCNAFMGNALVDMYAKCRYVKDARQVFDKMPERNVVSWNAIVGGYALNRHSDEALELFQKMPERNLVSWNVIIVGFLQSGCVDYALELFCEMPEKNIVSWNAMLAGFVKNGCSDDALVLFRQMRQRGVKADSVTVASILPACGDLASLQHGKEVHEDVVRYGAQFNISVRNALVDMYAKCGSIEDARKVFDETLLRNVISWTAMIVGYAMHGYGKEALQIFEQMPHSDSKPNSVTFIGVLSACCHAGLVDDGWKYFHNMSKVYQITPSLKHYSCMVDLLGRAGHLNEAEDFINKMPIKPDVDVWASLLGACRIHNHIEIGERVAEHLFELDPKASAHYVQLSNMYAEAGMWDDVENVRKRMKARGIKKMPGCSWIEVNNKVFAFFTGDKSFSEMKEIYANMDTISGLWADGGRVYA